MYDLQEGMLREMKFLFELQQYKHLGYTMKILSKIIKHVLIIYRLIVKHNVYRQ